MFVRGLAFLWAMIAGAVAFAAEPPASPFLRIETGNHASMARRLAVDVKNNRLITGGDDKTVRIWQLPEGRLHNVLRLPVGDLHEGRVFAVAAHPEGRLIAVGGWTGWDWDGSNSVYIFDAESGEIVQRIAGLRDVIGTLNFSPDGAVLAIGLQANAGLHFYRTSDWQSLAHDREYGDKVMAADFHRDGRLAVVALDGYLRIYANAKLIGRKRLTAATKPVSVRFSPDGERIALGHLDRHEVTVMSSRDFSTLFSADPSGLPEKAIVSEVAWSSDGRFLYVAGDEGGVGATSLYRWTEGGRGKLERFPLGHGRVADLQTLAGGAMAFSTEDPAFGIVDSSGAKTLFVAADIISFREIGPELRVSRDGSVVEFGLYPERTRRMRFSLRDRTLLPVAAPGADVASPGQASQGVVVAGWKDGMAPTVNGAKITMDDYETSRSYAIAPDASAVYFGTEWAIRAVDANGRQRWRTQVPSIVWSVNATGDGELLLAALSDGTLRWYRTQDGVEVMAAFIHGGGEEWIAFTPQGYYVSSNYGDNFVGWHLNRGKDRSGDFYRAVQFERILYRPDVLEAWFASRGRDSGIAARGGEAFDIKDLALIAPPRIRIGKMASALAPDGTARLKVAFEVEKNSLPMRDYAVYVNNIPVTPTRERQLEAREDGRFAREVEVELQSRDSVVRIEVNNGRSIGLAEKAFALREAAITRTAPGELYLLAVGVNHFPKLTGADLAYAARDAEQLERFFAGDGKRQYSKVHTRVLSDVSPDKPERAAILDALNFISAAGPRDTVIVFLASHGISDPAGNYYFVPRDATGEDVDAVIKGEPRKITSLIGWSSFFEALRGVAGRRLLIVDTCQAKNIEGRLDVHSLSKRSASSLFSLVVASKGNEESQEYPPGKHGLFTYAMLNSLRGEGDANRDGFITLNEMFGAATPVVDKLRNRVLGPQSPQILAPEPLGNMILVRAGTAAPVAAPAAVENAACGVRTLLVGARDPRCATGGGAPVAPAPNTGCGVRNLVVGARDTNCAP